MKKLMVFVDWFIPGFKAGGQLRSCTNLANAMQGVFDIYVVTSDRDMGDAVAYPGIQTNTWLDGAGGYKVIYLSANQQNAKKYAALISEVNPHCIYLNSMFSYRFTILPLIACRRYQLKTKIVLAPRGMLHKGALQYKSLKKKVFLRLFRTASVHRRVIFHATDPREFDDIRKQFGESVEVELVDDFPATVQAELQVTEKRKGELRCLFISRICQTKNLDYILNLLPRVNGNLTLSVLGPTEDEAYYQKCMELVKGLPANIKVQFEGAVPNQSLPPWYKDHHLFILPTHGENFGHVIFDSFLNGRPVLISDLTPWKGLSSQGAGWDIPLANEPAYVQALNEAASWDQEQFQKVAADSWNFAYNYIRNLRIRELYAKLFA